MAVAWSKGGKIHHGDTEKPEVERRRLLETVMGLDWKWLFL